jgi:protoheme IX farnesyltransferase
MPHSYAIAIFRARDYKAASIPVFPVIKGVSTTKRHIVVYIVAFTGATLMLGVLGYVGKVYMLAAFLGGVYWFRLGLAGWTVSNDIKWARKVFFTSIALITVLSVAMSVDFHRPLPSQSLVLQGP